MIFDVAGAGTPGESTGGSGALVMADVYADRPGIGKVDSS
jgi:hypothetical protein